MSVRMNPNLKSFWGKYAPIKLLYGGRDSSKTKDTALFLTTMSANYKLRIMCARQFQNRVEQSVYTEIKWAIGELKLNDLFTITNNSIKCDKTGSEFFFYGIRRNLSDIKGTADIDIMWIEEGEDLTKEQFEAIEPTVRKQGSFIIILFNPQLATDYIWTDLVLSERKDIDRRLINYNDNPFLSQKSLDRISDLKERDEDNYNHIYLGNPKSDDNQALIKRKWLMACIDAHKVLNIDVLGNSQIGYDVADDGTDTNAKSKRDGRLLNMLEEWNAGEDELFNSTEKVYRTAETFNAKIVYDANGLGAGTGSNCKRLNIEKEQDIDYYGFDSAESPINPKSFYMGDDALLESKNPTQGIINSKFFENRKAQAWWLFKDDVLATYNAVSKGTPIDNDRVVSFDGNLELLQKLITELATPRKAQSGRLKNMVEKKSDLSRRGIKSPNLADCVIMCFWQTEKIESSGFLNSM